MQKDRVKDFKAVIIKYLESLVQTQQQVPVHLKRLLWLMLMFYLFMCTVCL